MMANIEIYVTKPKNTEDSYHSYYIITTALVNKQSITQHLSMWVKKLATPSVSSFRVECNYRYNKNGFGIM